MLEIHEVELTLLDQDVAKNNLAGESKWVDESGGGVDGCYKSVLEEKEVNTISADRLVPKKLIVRSSTSDDPFNIYPIIKLVSFVAPSHKI